MGKRKKRSVKSSTAKGLIEWGVIPCGTHAGKKPSDLSEQSLKAVIGALLDDNRKVRPFDADLVKMLLEEQAKRSSPPSVSGVGPQEESRAGLILWGHCAGQLIQEQTDEALRGAIWAAEKRHFADGYLESLREEQTRREADSPIDREFSTMAGAF